MTSVERNSLLTIRKPNAAATKPNQTHLATWSVKGVLMNLSLSRGSEVTHITVKKVASIVNSRSEYR